MTRYLIDLERRGLELRNAGRLKEAAELFSTLVEKQPDWEHGAGFYDLAICYEDLGQLQLAEEAYQSALQYQPANRDFLGGLASFLHLHGDPERAFRRYLELLELDLINKDIEGAESSKTALRTLGQRIGFSQAEIEEQINKHLV